MINSKMVCPKCKGKGKTLDPSHKNPLIVVFTFGLSLGMWETCNTCKGCGWIFATSE